MFHYHLYENMNLQMILPNIFKVVSFNIRKPYEVQKCFFFKHDFQNFSTQDLDL
jgi:hypothetical protein